MNEELVYIIFSNVRIFHFLTIKLLLLVSDLEAIKSVARVDHFIHVQIISSIIFWFTVPKESVLTLWFKLYCYWLTRKRLIYWIFTILTLKNWIMIIKRFISIQRFYMNGSHNLSRFSNSKTEKAPRCMTTQNVNMVQTAGHKSLRIYIKYSTLKKYP